MAELTMPVSPGADAALAGGDDDAAERRKFFQSQRERLERLGKQEEEMYAHRETEMAPQRQALEQQTKTFAQTSENALATLKTTQTELPKFNPEAARGDAMAWMSLAAGFGAIAGTFSRYHTTTALNAFSGMMNGFAKGQLEVFEQKYQEWQTEADRAHEYNARSLREYNAVMNNAKLNLDAKSNLMQMIAEKWQDQLMANAAQMRSVERMTQLMDAQDRFDQNMQFRRDAMAQRKEQFDTKLDAQLREKGFKRDETGKIVPDPDNPGAIDDAALDVMVERRLLGDKSVVQNIGRGAQGSANIARFNNRLAATMTRRGIEAKDLAQLDQQFAGQQAYQVAAGRYASRVENATNELQAAIPLAEQASANFKRDDWVHWNSLITEYAKGTSDPKYNDFIIKAMSARNAYVRAMNPTGNPRIAERLELQADKILDAAVGPQAFSTQLRGMWQEAENSRRAVAETRGLPLPEARQYPNVTPDPTVTDDLTIENPPGQ